MDSGVNIGNAGLVAARFVIVRGFGELERSIEKGVPEGRAKGREHTELAVLDPTGRVRVLAGDTHALDALLEEPHLIDDQDAVGVAQIVDDPGPLIVADRTSGPANSIQQTLDAVRRGIADGLGQLPGVLALDAGHEPAQLFLGPQLEHLGAASVLDLQKLGSEQRIRGGER